MRFGLINYISAHFLCFCKESDKESTADFPACVPSAGRDADLFLSRPFTRPKSALSNRIPSATSYRITSLPAGRQARRYELSMLYTRCRGGTKIDSEKVYWKNDFSSASFFALIGTIRTIKCKRKMQRLQ